MDGLKFDSSGLNIRDNIGLNRTKTSESNTFPKDNSTVPGESFATTLKKAVGTVDSLQKDADVKMQELATGKSQNIHETMIAAEKADIALKLMVQVRNKIIEAYQEIMKMQV
jgi:flagellar hook-basal body complex protein FliE